MHATFGIKEAFGAERNAPCTSCYLTTVKGLRRLDQNETRQNEHRRTRPGQLPRRRITAKLVRSTMEKSWSRKNANIPGNLQVRQSDRFD